MDVKSKLCLVVVVALRHLQVTNQGAKGLRGRGDGLKPLTRQATPNRQTEAEFHVCKGLVPVKLVIKGFLRAKIWGLGGCM